MNDLREILDQARTALTHRLPEQAERLAQRALTLSPSLAPAWQVLAQARSAQGRADDALAAWRHLAGLLPGSPEAQASLAEALFDAGQVEEAARHLTAWASQPGADPEWLARAGLLLAQRGRVEEAVALMSRAAEALPGDARLHNNLGVALSQAGRQEEAVGVLREAARLDSGYAEPWYNLGNILNDLKRTDEAADAYRQALERRHDHHGALNNLGLLLQGSGKPGEAAVLLRQAYRLSPNSPEARNNLGLALADLGRFEQAEALYHEALALKADYVDAHVNLGCSLKELDRTEEALASFDMALRIEPRQRSARYNRALTLLQAGDWEKGWADYEYRWGRKAQPERPMVRPRWDGADLAGKTVLCWCEQGLGDAIQFVRFAEMLKAKGAGRVIVECPPPLARLFAGAAGVDEVAREGDALPEHDCQVPLMGLLGLLWITPENVPGGEYLVAEPERVERWRAVLGPSPGLRVGVVWQGNPRFEWDRWRSVKLEAFGVLAGVEGVELVSLQKGPAEEQVEALRGRFAVRRLDGLDEDAPFMDTAAVLMCLDLLVCVDTSVGHLAGALGVPTWVALSKVCDWRWMRGREDTVWYERHWLFRQREAGDWAGVFARMADGLRAMVEGRARRGAVLVPTAAGEVLDRLSILRIKAERIKDEAKLGHVRRELAVLEGAARGWLGDGGVAGLLARLKAVNERLWEVEDALRDCEAGRDFSDRFVELARSVYRLNDERNAIKREVNMTLGAVWSDQKQYGSR